MGVFVPPGSFLLHGWGSGTAGTEAKLPSFSQQSEGHGGEGGTQPRKVIAR